MSFTNWAAGFCAVSTGCHLVSLAVAAARLRVRHRPLPAVSSEPAVSLLRPLYAAADVFVLPSRTDTFGLVILEALACGLPIAAYPVPGPLDIVGESRVGALDEDLRAAALAALAIPRERCRAHPLNFTWAASARQFLANLRPIACG